MRERCYSYQYTARKQSVFFSHINLGRVDQNEGQTELLPRSHLARVPVIFFAKIVRAGLDYATPNQKRQQ